MKWRVPFGRGAPAGRWLLADERLAGPTPWILAILMFMALLAGTAAVTLNSAAGRLDTALQSRLTVQIVVADPVLRERQATAAAAALRELAMVTRVERVADAELGRLLAPYIGDGAIDEDLPVPALIDVDLVRSDDAAVAAVSRAVRSVAPAARIDRHADWLAPLGRLIRLLGWLSLGIVAMMVVALAAAVTLTARAALNTHRATLEVLHLMGATDRQIARLFQWRIGVDALIGGLISALGAAIIVGVIAFNIRALESDLVAATVLPPLGWALLVLLPLGGTLVAVIAARATVLAALRKML